MQIRNIDSKNALKKLRKVYYKTSNAITKINPSLVIANMGEFDVYLDNNPKVGNILFTSVDDLCKDYLCFLREVFRETSRYNLYDLIKIGSMGWKNIFAYFLKENGKIVAWCCYYLTSDNVVDEIKVISFSSLESTLVLFDDFYTFSSSLLKKYGLIYWEADSNNPVCNVYDSVLDKYKSEGFLVKTRSENNKVYYEVSIK